MVALVPNATRVTLPAFCCWLPLPTRLELVAMIEPTCVLLEKSILPPLPDKKLTVAVLPVPIGAPGATEVVLPLVVTVAPATRVTSPAGARADNPVECAVLI